MEKPNTINKLYEMKFLIELDKAVNSNTPLVNLHELNGKVLLAGDIHLITRKQQTELELLVVRALMKIEINL